jgi:hypothetical protein
LSGARRLQAERITARRNGNGISHRAGWRQDSAFFLGTACRQKWQLTEIFGAYELKSIAIQ